MNESEFIRLAEQALQEIDRRIEASGVDVDCRFKGTGVLEIEFDDGSKIIVNSQAAAREIWVAAKSGGYHFRGDGGRWVNTRDGADLFTALSACVSQQAGESVNLADGDTKNA
jgi:CyaY protein